MRMSFRTASYSSGVLLSEELTLLQSIFKEISSQPWFSRAPEDQQAFAAYVIKTYLRGLTEPEKLKDFCTAAAKSRYMVVDDANPASTCRTTPRR
jgi:hypothetical protein